MEGQHSFKHQKVITRNLYFTEDHEWIDFQGSVAYVGVCKFKLAGVKGIQNMDFVRTSEIYQAGDIIGSINYEMFKINIRMPVAGKLLNYNVELLSRRSNLLIDELRNNAWFASIIPTKPYDRLGLIFSSQYGLRAENTWKN